MLNANTMAANNANSLKNNLNNISSDTTEEELKQICKDFESYFVEQVIKEVKENLLSDEEEESSSLSTLTDYSLDFAVEEIADQLVEEVGTSFTQSLYEQMKRNYNIE